MKNIPLNVESTEFHCHDFVAKNPLVNCVYGNLVSYFFDKNFVKATFLLKQISTGSLSTEWTFSY